MRNMRNAFWALGLAGAAYAWKNRSQLQQQFGRFGQRSAPQQLPDYQSNNQQDSQQQNSTWDQPRTQQFGGSEV